MTLLLHVLINRLFGRLQGWPRVAHWPVMQLAASATHLLISSAPVFWLLQWSSNSTGLTAVRADLYSSMLAALAGALLVRRQRRAGRLP